jgi:hypothetical protein
MANLPYGGSLVYAAIQQGQYVLLRNISQAPTDNFYESIEQDQIKDKNRGQE